MKKTIIVLLTVTFFLLAGCNSEDTGKNGGSYQIVTVLNNGEQWSLNSDENPEEYEQGELLTSITKKTNPDELPDNNQSNYFEKGTKIFEVKGNESLIMAIEPSGKKSILSRSSD